MADSSDKTQPNANDVLRSRLKTMTPQLATSVKGNNVYILADIMWSENHISDFEKDDVLEMRLSSRDALRKLLDYAYARGGKSIMGIAHALRKIEMHKLADQLYPADNVVVLPSATAGASLSMHLSATTLIDNLQKTSCYVSQHISQGELDAVIARLKSMNYIIQRDIDRIEAKEGTIKQAEYLINDVIIKSGSAAKVKRFLKMLQDDAKRKDLADIVRSGKDSS